jgi:hypothetical protein
MRRRSISTRFAKLLLVCEVEDLRDPKEALTLSRRANDQTKETDPVFLRTLAEAWFDTGDRAKPSRRRSALSSVCRPSRLTARITRRSWSSTGRRSSA